MADDSQVGFRDAAGKEPLGCALRRSSFTPRPAGMPAGMSGRAIEKKYRAGRRTVVKTLLWAWPEPRKQLPPRASKLDRRSPRVPSPGSFARRESPARTARPTPIL